MGGPYPDLYCAICDDPITDEASVVSVAKGQYNESDEVIQYEPFAEEIYHKECFGRRWLTEPGDIAVPI